MKNCRGIYFFSLLLVSLLTISKGKAQEVVFSDNFSSSTNATYTTSGQIGSSAWSVSRSGADWGARRNTSPAQLECTNDVGATANVAGFVLVSTPTTSFNAPFNPILNQNTGVITWTFNMRQIRADPAGFNGNSYGVAFILAGETATNSTTGSGYAVVLGQTGAVDPIRLVKYVTGVDGDAGLTNIIVSNTSMLSDFGADYLSIKVTYNPCNNNTWQLFVRNDGATAFADPLTGTLTSQGTASDATNTGISLGMMAAFWRGDTGASQTAFFDNVTVSINSPTLTLGPTPKPCVGSTLTTVSYTNLSPGSNQYSIDWDATANANGFTDVTNATLPSSPIQIPMSGSAPIGTYNGTLTLKNTTTNCTGQGIPISVQIKNCVNPLPSTMQWVLLANGESNGICNSSTDCSNDMLCYGLQYTPLFTGNMTSYTTGFLVTCYQGENPILSIGTCTGENGNSFVGNFCATDNVVLFNASANGGIVTPVIKGVPQIIHQICFIVPTTGSLTITCDDLGGQAINTSIDSINGGGFESDFIQHCFSTTIDSSVICNTLPLTWLNFNATASGEFVSKLEWSTSQEINVSHFEIQRSLDHGKSFQKIGRVDAHNRNDVVNHYSFFDRNAKTGQNLYRIKQFDFDQKSDFSPIRTVSFSGKKSLSVNVRPNPVTDELTIDIEDANEALNLSIIDINGSLVWKGRADAGSAVQIVDVSNLGAGIYSLVSEGISTHNVQKIVVLR